MLWARSYIEVCKGLMLRVFFYRKRQLLLRETFADSGITPVQFGMLSGLQLDNSLVDAFSEF